MPRLSIDGAAAPASQFPEVGVQGDGDRQLAAPREGLAAPAEQAGAQQTSGKPHVEDDWGDFQ